MFFFKYSESVLKKRQFFVRPQNGLDYFCLRNDQFEILHSSGQQTSLLPQRTLSLCFLLSHAFSLQLFCLSGLYTVLKPSFSGSFSHPSTYNKSSDYTLKTQHFFRPSEHSKSLLKKKKQRKTSLTFLRRMSLKEKNCSALREKEKKS